MFSFNKLLGYFALRILILCFKNKETFLKESGTKLETTSSKASQVAAQAWLEVQIFLGECFVKATPHLHA